MTSRNFLSCGEYGTQQCIYESSISNLYYYFKVDNCTVFFAREKLFLTGKFKQRDFREDISGSRVTGFR